MNAMQAGFLWRVIQHRLRRRIPEPRVESILVELFDDYRPRRRAGRIRAALWLVREARSLSAAYGADRRARARADRAPLTDVLWRDLRLGWRSLMATPGVTAAIGLTLAIGIGANAAIFAIVNGVLLRPLPYPDEARVVSLAQRSPGSSTDIPSAPYLYYTYRESARTVERVGLWSSGLSTVIGLDRPDQVRAVYVTHEILPLLGVTPLVGTTFSEEDDRPSAALTVVLSWGYWQRRFGGDSSILGRQLTVDGMSASVIGVLPRTFSFLDQPVDLMYPFQLDRSQVTLGRYVFQGLARLRPGVTLADATTELTKLVPDAIQRFPPPTGFTRERFASRPVTTHLMPIRDVVIGDVGKTLWVLMGALGLLLVIACANVAHLLLVRADGRRRAIAIQAAMGATRGRIVLSHLVEGAILGGIGSAGGLVVAFVTLQAVRVLGPATLPRADDIAIDPLEVLFTIAIALAAGLCLGLLPILRIARRNLAPALVENGRGMTEGKSRRLARGAMVVVQVALALVLLVCSGLMIRTFANLSRVEPGFTRAEEVQLVYVPGAQPDPGRATQALHDISDAIGAIPGVTAVGFGDRPPLGDTNRRADTVLTVEASTQPRIDGQPRPLRRFEFITPPYFKALGVPMLTGREFDWTDLDKGRQVAIVSAELARQEWGGVPAALGKRVQITPADPWREVVGVAGDIRDNGMRDEAPAIIYFPSRVQHFWGAPDMAFGNGTFAIRSSRAGTDSFIQDIEHAVARVNANLPVSQVRRLSDVYRASMARTSFTLTLLLVAGGLGLLLGVIGIYGVIAYTVTLRTREVGIRLALGAQRGEVTGLFLRRGILLAVAGLVAGVIAAVTVTRLMSSLLFGVSPLDPSTYAVVALTVLTVVTFAAYVPARRAARRGCVDALRAE